MVTEKDVMDEATREAARRFAERAEKYRDYLEEQWHGILPGNHSPAEAILLAHLMTAVDGYQPIVVTTNWQRRPVTGWQTSLGYLVEVGREVVSFAFEARYDQHARQLAVLLDEHRLSERTPDKLQKETALVAKGWRVMSLTATEVVASPEICRERIEAVLSDLVDDVLSDAGIL